MKFHFKKLLSLFLVFTLLFSVIQINITAKSKNNIPVIVINGIDHNPLYENPDTLSPSQIFPPADMTVYGLLTEMFASSIVSLVSNDYNQVIDFFVGSQLYDIMEKISLNPDGTSKSENIGPIKYEHSLAYYYTDVVRYEKIAGNIGLGLCDKIGMDNVYVFTYDWRIDPVANANELNDFIQVVKANSCKDKVSIMSEGYGSTIAFAYLAEHYEDATADIDNFVTVNSAAMGTSLIGDIYTGRLMRQYNELQNATCAFIRFTNDISDNSIKWFSTWITNYILNNNWEIQDFIAQCITMMGHVTDPLYDRYLRDMLKNFIGLWAMVPVEYYEEAMDFMFMSDESTSGDYNSEFQEKVQLYKNYQESAAEILNKAKSEGININVVSSWDLQLIPIGDNKASDEELFGLSAQSDGLIDTYYSSFGCHTIPLNDVGAAIFNKDQRNQEGECENHNHMNAVYDILDPEHNLGGIAHYLDASTCALPDNTWFIRNMKHGTFATGSNSMDFLEFLITADNTIDVFSTDDDYNQFMSYNRYLKPGYLDIYLEESSTGESVSDEEIITEETDCIETTTIEPETEITTDEPTTNEPQTETPTTKPALIEPTTQLPATETTTNTPVTQAPTTENTKEPDYHIHDYIAIVTAPDCTKQGYTTYTCLCGDTFKDNYIDEKGHSRGDWITETPATTGVSGVEICKCTECDMILAMREIPALPEETTIVPVIPETTTISEITTIPENTTKEPVIDPDEKYKTGDVNNDDKITAADARTVLRASAKLETFNEKTAAAADVNKDKKITAADARTILRVSAKLEKF